MRCGLLGLKISSYKKPQQVKKRFDIVRRVSSKFFELKLWSCSRRCSNIDFHPVTVWERSGILSHMFWWFWIHENWKFSLFCRKYMKSCLAELGVELIKLVDPSGHSTLTWGISWSLMQQGGFITWGGRNLYKLSTWLDGHVVSFSIPFVVSKIWIEAFAPTRGFPPEFWISLSVPMNRLRSGSIQRLQTCIVPTHAAFCHVHFAFVANGKMASLTNRCLHPTFFRLWQITSYWKTQFGSVSFAEQFCEDRFLNGAGYGKNHFFKRQGSQRSRGTRNAKKTWECCLWKNSHH